MQTPFFSVIIPTYNRSKLLKIALDSVINQTFTDFEIIVIDDHSTDNTEEIIRNIKDDRIIYLLNYCTSGGAGTRNSGIFKAKGQWIAFLDDDDTWMRDKLQKQYEKITEIDESVGLIYSGFKHKSSRPRWNNHIFTPKFQGKIINLLLYDNYIGALCTVIIRKNILIDIGGFDERFKAHQDLDLYVRVAEVTNVAYVIDCLATVYLHNEDRISLNYSKKLEAVSLFWEKHYHNIKKSSKLTHRAASRVFVFAFPMRDSQRIKNSFFWALSGLFIDPKNFIWMIRSTVSIYLKKLRQKK